MFYIVKEILRFFIKWSRTCSRDERTVLPFMDSLIYMFAIISIYLLFVLRWGPRFMRNRKPYNVQKLMQIYNVVQVILNLYVFIYSLRYSYLTSKFSLHCQPYNLADKSADTMNLVGPAIVYFLTKYLDLLDTVFFVLRKKQNQITFLHVYHHTIMVFGVWVYVKLLFGSHFTLTGVMNSFIHVCMYTYYFVSSLKLGIPLDRWKRRLTQAQIVQFICLVIHYGVPLTLVNCDIDMFWAFIAFSQNIFMLILFSDFYVKAYIKKPKRQQQQQQHASEETALKAE